ncbi:Partial AB-hydrolase lipase domain,Alpha/Beta hydrolase fold [Cinara cedri]|uniref:Partial AB-hydrolase lipase domain,Alpha/Beta hydrolase fold n=1 Tax=Cinara cedri TaxID=506608 RepID=A0A5E4LYV3_9HEMI|nr:Partial AB-hydrolase lipase domain,Alpha/Beta hydrolase fold [Cinara cedri]
MLNMKFPLFEFRLFQLQIFFNLWLLLFIIANTPRSYASDVFKNKVSLSTVEIIQKNGYAVEIHEVVTEDGYILEMHRIPRNRRNQDPTKNHPVFVHHGLLGSSADWVLAGANMSLPMQLSDAGFDVWLTNCRGNTYSRKHTSLTVNQNAFWDFSIDEIGKYDLPAAIDYILIETNSSQLHYIGFSMGTSVFFIMASERPEYQPKIRSQISLAPVAYLTNSRSIVKHFAVYSKIINTMFQRISKGMFMPHFRTQDFLASTLCTEKLTRNIICETCFIFSICGSDPYDFDADLIPSITSHSPAGTSAKLTTHYAQLMLKDTFCQYDYGTAMNMRVYNSTVPPTYDLKSIQVPITLIYGENDILSVVKDVTKLKDQLPKLMDFFPVDNPYCNHVDLLWSKDVTIKINNPVKEILLKTDDMDWIYPGPNFSLDTKDTSYNNVEKIIYNGNLSLYPTTNSYDLLGLDFFKGNLDTLIRNTMPISIDDNDTEEFERQRKVLNVVLENMIDFSVSIDTENKRSHQGYFSNKISNWVEKLSTDFLKDLRETKIDYDRN